jgi:subtilisin family serine protease
MRRASPLALAALLAIVLSPLAAQPAAAAPAPRFPALPEDSAKAHTKLTAAGRYIVTMKDGTSVDKAKGRAVGHGVKVDKTFTHAVHGFSAKLDPAQLADLRSDPDVADVVPDEVISMTAQTRPTGIRRVNAPESLISNINGVDGDITSGQRVDADVAIVDTGIDKNHVDLNVVGGISCSTSNPNAWGDPNGHGTHVAGIVGALDNNIGVVGVAPGVRLWAVRILDSAGNGLLSWYVCGLDWIAAQRDPTDPSRPLIEAVNMSVAKAGKDDNNCGYTNDDVMHKAVCRVVAAGITVVAAAGNNHFNAANLKPASYNEVITVSALADTDGRAGGEGGNLCYSWGGYDKDDTFADFSNYGSDVDLIAPGKCIYSTLPGNRYGYLSGTSMAAPHVTGAAALYKASRPQATPAEVRAALRAAGNEDWNTSTDPDGTHEPLLDVSHIVALGDFALDATPGTSNWTWANAAGGTFSVPVSVVRAEDFAAEVDVSVNGGSPFGASLDQTKLIGQDQVSTTLSFTVPPNTPSGTYEVTLTATDGTRQRTSVYPIRVDSVAPTIGKPAMRLRAGSYVMLTGTAAGTGVWPVGTDPGGSITAYQLRWRVDGNLQAPVAASPSAARETYRTMARDHAYSLLVRARDRAGNWSAWSESTTFKPGVWDDTSPTLVRHGSWGRSRFAPLLGGTALYSSSKGASLTRAFNGRAFGLVVSRGPGRGTAQLWIDGALAATIDEHRATSSYRYLEFARAWPASGRHTVKVVVLHSPAGHPRVDVDAFLIVP